MVETLVMLKQDKPILFKITMLILALPIAGLLVISIISPAIRSWLVSSAKRLMDKTQKRDSEIKKEIDDTQKEIDKLDAQLYNVNQKLETIANDDDANWHKGVKKK
jgi:peptidoglycan hydrolase CwlO-like protein